jgi:hypothetical protein
MSPDKEGLRQKTVDELRKEARDKGVAHASSLKKEELVSVLADKSRAVASSSSGGQIGTWVRDRSLGIFFISLFLVSWIAQLVVQWFDFQNQQQDHGQVPEFWSGEFWYDFWKATLENWQSEFLQLATFTIAAAYLVYKGSSESPDGNERLEQKIDWLLEDRGIDPREVEAQLPPKYRKN